MPKVDKPLTTKNMYEILAQFYEDVLHPRFTTLETKLSAAETNLESKIAEVKSDLRDIKRRQRDQEFDTPTRKEHEQLKTRVAKLEKAALN